MNKNELESLKKFIERKEHKKENSNVLESTIANNDSNSEDDIFIQETSIELVPTKTVRTSINEDKLKKIIIPIIKNDKEFYNSIKGKKGKKGKDGKDGVSPNPDDIIDNLVNILKNKNSYLNLVKGKDAPQLEEITKNLIVELKKDTKFLESIKGKDGLDGVGGWGFGGGLGEGDVNALIDAKINNISDVDNNTIYVAISGSDEETANGTATKPFASIKYALSQITDVTEINRYIIKVTPGLYAENNPIQMKQYVSVVGDSPNSCLITAQNDDVLFSMIDSSLLKCVGCGGSTSATTIDISTSGFLSIDDVAIFAGDVGVNINNTNVDCSISRLIGIGTGDKLININSGKIILRDTYLTSISNYHYGIFADGSDAIVYGYGYIDESRKSLSSIYVDGFATLDIKDGRIHGDVNTTKGVEIGDALVGITNMQYTTCNCGLYVPPITTSTIANFANSYFQECVDDVCLLSPNMRIAGGGLSNSDKVFINPNATIVAGFIDSKEGDEGFTVLGEFHVGTPNKPAESCLGEGDSYTTSMIVYTYDGTSFEDVSVSARSNENSTFGFPNVNVNTAIYEASIISGVDGEPLTHLGIKANILSAHDGTGSIISEYYTSAGWVEIKTMSTNADSPYYPDANNIFRQTSEYQIRYDNTVVNDGWWKNDPVGYGTDLYWIRHRIISTIDSPPLFEQFKLHANRMEINGDGWPEYFGKSRPIGRLPWSWSGMQQGSTPISNQNVFLSSTLDIGRRENNFNTNGDRVGFITNSPLDCDTSTPILFEWTARASTTGSSTWTIRWGYSSDGDSVDLATGGSTITEQSVIETKNMTVGTQTNFRVELDVSNMISRRKDGFGDTLWVTLEATSRPGNTNVIGIDANGYYTKWCQGGHI